MKTQVLKNTHEYQQDHTAVWQDQCVLSYLYLFFRETIVKMLNSFFVDETLR